jgi:hypothetical protein
MRFDRDPLSSCNCAMNIYLKISWSVAVSVFFGVQGFAGINAQPAQLTMRPCKPGEVATATLQIVNSGDKLVNVLKVESDCGCTTVTMEKRSISAGASGVVEISIAPGNFQGDLRRNVTVETAEEKLTIPIRLWVTPYENWKFDPAMVILRDAEEKMHLRYLGDGKVTLGKIVTVPDVVVATVESSTTNDFELSFRKHTDDLPSQSVKVTVETSDSVAHELSFVVFVAHRGLEPTPASVKSETVVRVSPSALNLGLVTVGEKAVGYFAISGWTRPDGPKVQMNRGSIRLLEASGGELRYEVSWVPPIPGLFTSVVTVFDDDSLRFEIPVVVRATPST